MPGINAATIVGRVGQDVDIKYGQNGDAIVNLTIATSEKWKGKNDTEATEHTEWHRIVMFGRLAEVCGQWVKKGDLLGVTGKIQTRSWEKDGIKRYSTEIVARDMQMLGSKGTKPEGTAPVPTPTTAPGSDSFDSIPF